MANPSAPGPIHVRHQGAELDAALDHQQGVIGPVGLQHIVAVLPQGIAGLERAQSIIFDEQNAKVGHSWAPREVLTTHKAAFVSIQPGIFGATAVLD
jgi:hypothetical protein